MDFEEDIPCVQWWFCDIEYIEAAISMCDDFWEMEKKGGKTNPVFV